MRLQTLSGTADFPWMCCNTSGLKSGREAFVTSWVIAKLPTIISRTVYNKLMSCLKRN